MALVSPLALLLLVPWALAVVWAMRGQTSAAVVPFLRLWERSPAIQNRSRHTRVPPPWLILLLGAILAAIGAAAGPAIRSNATTTELIIDCRLPMSAARMSSALATLNLRPGQAMHAIPVPGKPFDVHGSIDAASLQFTANGDDTILRQILRDALARSGGPVYLLTDLPLPMTNDRLRAVRPIEKLNNAGIEHFAVEADPYPQAMVRVFNDSIEKTATLTVDDTQLAIELPVRGTARNYFLDLPRVGQTITARLHIQDDVAADDYAFLARGAAWPKIEVRANVSDGLRHMIDVYAARRPPTGEIPTIEVWASANSAASLSVIIPTDGGRPISQGTLSVDLTSPLARDVDWQIVTRNATVHLGPGADFKPVIRRGEDVIVGVRDAPRQVWVNIDDDAWSKRPDYVVFWTNVFDWLAQSDPRYTSIAVPASLDRPQAVIQSDSSVIDCPGLYREATGRIVATSIKPLRSAPVTTTDNQSPIVSPIDRLIPLDQWLLVAAAGLFMLALASRRA